MNDLRRLLVHVNDAQLAGEALLYGATLARQHGAELSALLAVDTVAAGAYLNAETASLAAQLAREHQAEQREAASALVESVQRRTGLTVELLIAAGPAHEALIEASRAADLLIVSQREPGHSAGLEPGAAARLLAAAACPLLFVPPAGWHAPALEPSEVAARQVLAAWSDTREAARALHDALPLMQRAARVELVVFVHGETAPDQPPPALQAAARRLALHGVQAQVTVRRCREPKLSQRLRRGPDVLVAEALLAYAAETGADLLVMGGYGHSRAWEMVLGGVTRTLLQTMNLPVFMGH